MTCRVKIMRLVPLGLYLVVGIFGFAFAQAPPATPNLSDLARHSASWPKELTLKTDVRLAILAHGKEVGAITSPAGSNVNLASVTATGLEIQVGSASATVAPEQTDLWERVAAASAKTSTIPTTPVPAVVAPSAPPPSTSIPATPPASFTADAASGPPLTFDYEVSPRDNFTKAAYRFWSPPYTDLIRGVIVLTPGLDGDGRTMLESPTWQSLARKYRLALVACFLQGGNYYNAMRGTGDALLEALKHFSEQASHPEIARVPLLLYGESAGGQFDYDFVLWKPERVLAFVVNKGGYYVRDEADSHARATPGLFFLGLTDSDLRINAIKGIWSEGRSQGALWALAPQPNSGHEFSKTAPLAQVFFDRVLKARLPDDPLSGDDPPPMKPMQESQGWLGDLTSHEVHDASTDSEPNRADAWFPDQDSANAWKAFVSN